jgi:hypothetical protein
MHSAIRAHDQQKDLHVFFTNKMRDSDDTFPRKIHTPSTVYLGHASSRRKKKFPFSLSDQTEACDEVITSK